MSNINTGGSIWVTPQSHLSATLQESGARHVIVFTAPGADCALPDNLEPKNCLVLTMNDITAPASGLIMPQREQVEALLEFDRTLPRNLPLVLTCYAGISRSTAGGYILSCRRSPSLGATALADLLRERAPEATPNARLIALGDELLAREGGMIAAIEAIGRGADAFAGTPFMLA